METLNYTDDSKTRLSFQFQLENYRQKNGYVGAEPLVLPHASIQDVLDTIAVVEQGYNHQSRLAAQNPIKDRLGSFITFLDRYSQALDCLIQAGSISSLNPAALIWGLLKVIMEAASSSRRYMANILALLEDIGHTVSLYNVYEELYFDQPRFRNAMAQVYMDIITMLDKIRHILFKNKKGRHLAIFRFFTNDFNAQFQDDVAVLRRHLNVLENETTMSHRTQMHKFVAEERCERNDSTKMIEFEERINRWLSPPDSRSRLADLNSIRHPGSGNWLLENITYQEWKQNLSKPSLLWLFGAPGMGKTVLSSMIVNNVQEWNQRQSMTSAIAYFHCDGGDASSTTFLGLCASLIAQLKAEILLQFPCYSLPQCITQAYEASVKFGRPGLSTADSPDKLIMELSLLFERTFLIIDGLDEMKEPEKAIESFLWLSSQTRSLRVVLLSRCSTGIRKRLEQAPQIHVTPADVHEDVRGYVKSRSQEVPVDGLATRDSIVDKICRKADGMFLWAKVILDDLCMSTNASDTEEMLDRCPPGLHAMYQQILNGFARQNLERRSLCKDILSWVICASRPLTITELQSAVATATLLQDCELYEKKKPFYSVVTEVCSPFVSVTTDGQFVRLVHQSVKEFLVDESNIQILDINISSFLVPQKEAHTNIAMRCLAFIAAQPSSPKTPNPDDTFYKYALWSWSYHTGLGFYRAELEAQIHELVGTSEERQAWLYQVLFESTVEPYPFQKIFQLQQNLSKWAQGSGKKETSIPSDKEFSLDALELILMLFGLREGEKAQERSTKNYGSNVNISYFERMMVVRDLARRLTQNGCLDLALVSLEALRAKLKESHRNRQFPFLLNIMAILYDQKELGQLSIELHSEALRLQSIAGSEINQIKNPDAIWTVNELGRMFRHLGRYIESEKMHKAALAVLTETLPEDHPEIIWTLNTMSRAFRVHDRPKEALDLLSKVYNTKSKSLGDLHPHALWTCGDIAKCYRDIQIHDEALSWFQRALDGRMVTLGPEHPDTLWSMNHLGMALSDQGRYKEALEVQAQALEGQVKVLGEFHKHTVWTRDVFDHLTTILQN